ncbi:UNVERIFIED_CONTAM: hypothetical protein Slati_4400700 [Sesamum latifolium]|uniref:Uncharacterized protein n=1 Tax=Sesamum latifolium TaxID=2727402 RepID=A0AAW2SPG0_9LAMI
MSKKLLCHDVGSERNTTLQEWDFAPYSLAKHHHPLHEIVPAFGRSLGKFLLANKPGGCRGPVGDQ